MSSLTSPFRPSDISTGLVGYWKFNNDATDSSGKGYDLTGVNTPAYAQEDYWKSGEYSTDLVRATPTYYTRARNADLDLLNAFTISCWIKADDTTGGWIIGKDAVGDGYGIYVNNGNSYFYMRNSYTGTDAAGAATTNRWTHLTFTYDQVNKNTYINGNLATSVAYSTDCTDAATDVYVGVNSTLLNSLDGHIKDLAIWSTALNPLQIKSLSMGVDLSGYAYRPNNVSTQPTHWWKLNEVSGNRADSVSTNPLTATDSGTVPSADGYIEGVSADFVSADYFTITDDASLEFGSGNFTMSAWIKPDGAGDATTQLMGKWNSAGGGEEYSWRYGGNKLIFYYTTNGSDYTGPITSTTALVAGNWYHIVARRNGTEFAYFIDGVKDGTTGDLTGKTFYAGARDFFIGLYSGGTGFDGHLQDVAIWKGYALTDAEIKSLACALPIQQQGIALYSKMNQTSGNETSEIGGYTLTDNGTVGSGTGKVGNSRDFNAAIPEYFLVTRDATLDLLYDFSIMMWAYPDDNTTVILADKDYAGNGYGCLIDASSKFNFYMNNATSLTTTSVPTTGYSFLAGVYTGAARLAYFNAVQEDSDAYSTNCADAAENLAIGVNNDGSTSPYDGDIDELVIAQRWFRPEEIKAVYLKGLNAKEATSTEVAPSTTGASNFLIFF